MSKQHPFSQQADSNKLQVDSILHNTVISKRHSLALDLMSYSPNEKQPPTMAQLLEEFPLLKGLQSKR